MKKDIREGGSEYERVLDLSVNNLGHDKISLDENY